MIPCAAPRAAPPGALPNGENRTSSGCGASDGAPRDFQRGGGATFSWFHPAPPPFFQRMPSGGTRGSSSRQQEGGWSWAAVARGTARRRRRLGGDGPWRVEVEWKARLRRPEAWTEAEFDTVPVERGATRGGGGARREVKAGRRVGGGEAKAGRGASGGEVEARRGGCGKGARRLWR
jgi:hypothetical protein